jgi:hypothetical protein
MVQAGIQAPLVSEEVIISGTADVTCWMRFFLSSFEYTVFLKEREERYFREKPRKEEDKTGYMICRTWYKMKM